MIEVRSVSKWYGDKQAACDLSFSIARGEIVGLLGLNGAGKSTVLKTLGTLTLPSCGEAFIAGYSVRTQAHEVRSHIGYLPDTPPIYDEMSVVSYLNFVGKLKGVARTQLKRAVTDVIDKTHLQSVMQRKLGELSHGFKQRANIAQALVHNPQVLILDEPINGLDPIQIVEMRDLILSLKAEHTVLLSSHILSEITKTCDRILVIDQGRLVAEGTERELRGKADDSFVVEIGVDTTDETKLQSLQSKLGCLEGVDEVSRLGSRLTLRSPMDLRSRMARLTVEEGFDLVYLQKKEVELETLFLKLVAGEKS